MRLLNKQWSFTFTFALILGFSLPGEGCYSQKSSAKEGEADSDGVVTQYRWVPGQSVTYRSITFDSLIVWEKRPRTVVRQQVSRLTYKCDTLLPEGFGMSLVLEGVVVKEQIDSNEWVTNNEHPWIGVPIRFLMGSDGERIRLRDTLASPGAMPGPPFQPLLIPHLGGVDTVDVGSGSVFSRRMWLLDNVYPPIQWVGGGMRKIVGIADTLGHKTVGVSLSETGQVWYFPDGRSDSTISIHTRINGSGTYWIDFQYGYPIAGEYQLIGNVTISDKNKSGQRSGRHTYGMEFQIDDMSQDLNTYLE